MTETEIEIMRSGDMISVTTVNLKIKDALYSISDINDLKIVEEKTSNPAKQTIIWFAFLMGCIGFILSGVFGLLVGVIILIFAAISPREKPIYLLTCLYQGTLTPLYKHLNLNEINTLKAGVEYAKSASP